MMRIGLRINKSIGVLSTGVLSTVPFLRLTRARSLLGIGRLHMISTRPMEAKDLFANKELRRRGKPRTLAPALTF